ncbi:MAG: hypothetical protein UR68_C0005G0017 [Candidatus Roizmanbacteria bacterium GW2011_GWA2_35_19]|uniref:Uncharacterized protein n=2 Tax=Candidatus Roizmaniibacteriota TaxID=1752723 RepID=A0A0G0BVH5_9BACT|nr:MAG: hypothetical protein UR63_C0005G0001 [Candidatus Roizmanbacteria bacterium GW2011_GWC2_35_12]KKP73283.1 MAG: hypothetical protein UR68_C0005G0017 [Candidatus Roizmanbacteria bacterium GW2011_GWA2_35_19]
MYRYIEVIPAEAGIQTKYSFIIINIVFIDWIPVFPKGKPSAHGDDIVI